ncbi:MAG: TA system VapC family ribonuclease toxin [Candidatus Methylacidiphilales bacterium]|nr:TA system VapC family ribonuclease toxin [Candidatus Methylacidiphilales bacterium]
MIIPDANILIYAHDEAAPHHAKARAWWEAALAGEKPVGLVWVVVLAFTRLLTHPTLAQDPLSVAEVRLMVEQWMESPSVRLLGLSEQALPRFFDLLEKAGGGGNLSTDALIALHAMEHSATVVSNDRDFDRFPGLKRLNPLV